MEALAREYIKKYLQCETILPLKPRVQASPVQYRGYECRLLSDIKLSRKTSIRDFVTH